MLTLVRKQKTTIGTLELDASLSETHGGEVEVTDHPVEQGANISDHRRVKPRSVTIEGLISNTPLPKDGDPLRVVTDGSHSFQTRSSGSPTRSSDALKELNAILLSSELIEIVTSLTSYKNMTMTSLSIPRDAKTGHALRFTATFREIRIVRNGTAVIEAKTTRAKPMVDDHKRTKKPSDGDDDARTRARKLIDHVEKDGAIKGFADFITSGGN